MTSVAVAPTEFDECPPTLDIPTPIGCDPESAIVGPVNGRYDLGPKIARGGMGIVYRAHDRLLNRTVAVKVMRGRFSGRADLMRRFLAEARISGRLQHPGIVPVYEVGTLPDGRPFIAMKLIEGQTLAKILRERTSPMQDLSQLLKVFDALCQTMAYAHQQGVIHRDLKPDNIMVGAFGEVQVMDWGLAKLLNGGDDPTEAEFFRTTPDIYPVANSDMSHSGHVPAGDHSTHATAILAMGPENLDNAMTGAGAVFGTVPFMPPEQARGDGDRVEYPADVFALGAILCQILTGQPPYFGSNDAVKENAREGKLFGAYVMLDRCGADHSLVLLAKHCLAYNAGDRPQDAGALAQMFATCLTNLSNQAKAIEISRLTAQSQLIDLTVREELATRARWLSRGWLVTAILFAGLAGGGWAWHTRDKERRIAAEEARRISAIQQIDDSLTEAATLASEARKAPGGAFARDAKARQAVAALQRAGALAEAVPGARDEWQARFDEVGASVATTERGARLAVALDLWRTDLIDPRGDFDPAAAAKKCAEVLSKHGMEVMSRPADVVGAEISDHPASDSIREVLADWLAVSSSSTERNHLVEVLKAVGSAPPAGWIAALESNDLSQLTSLDASEVPPAGIAVGARRLIQENNTADAEKILLRGARRHPNDFTLNALLGAIYRERPGGRADAIRYLSAALATRPSDPGVGFQLGSVLAEDGRSDEAIELLRRVIDADPKNVAARSTLGNAYAARGDRSSAKAAYLSALELSSQHAPAHLGLGQIYVLDNEPSLAETSFRQALSADPKSAIAHAGLGRLLADRNDHAAAIPELRQAVRSAPGDIKNRMLLAQSLRATGDRINALREAKSLAKLAAGDPAVMTLLANLLRENGDRKGALVAFRSLAASKDGNADVHRQVGELSLELSEPTTARDAFAKAIELAPDASLYVSLGQCEEKLGLKPEALKAYRRAIELDQTNGVARHRAGWLAVESGDEAGLVDLRLAVEKLASSADVRSDYGEALFRYGKFRESASTLRAAIALMKEDDERRGPLGDRSRRATKLAALESRLPDVLSGAVVPSTPIAWAEIAEVALRTRRYAAAAKFYPKAIDGDPGLAAPLAISQALAGYGIGIDSEATSPEDRAQLRAEALELLQRLPREVRQHHLLASVRSSGIALPSIERAAWARLWE